jgi:cytosine/adenosine deaminase-related metal-dependent hydrolase
MRIIQADYIFPLNQAPIKKGYLFIEDDGKVIHVTEIAPITDDFEVEKYAGFICPGFVNTHCHLELSHLKGLIPEAGGLEKFIDQIPKMRDLPQANPSQSMRDADKEMYAAGIVAVGDISNTTAGLEVKKKSPILYHSFVEVFGLDARKSEALLSEGKKVLETYRANNQSASLVPHAPYSVSPELLEGVYRHEKKSLKSIHHQESKAENQLFLDGEGGFITLFEGKGVDISRIKKMGISSSHYSILKHLSKDEKILLVHNTYSKQEDISLIEHNLSNAYWCSCPKSNWFIDRQLPDYELWRKNKLKITLGTDSLASNGGLSILEEMKCIQENFPQISTNELLTWACKNGAEFLSFPKLGSFSAGFNPGILLIKNTQGTSLTKESCIEVLC